MNRKGFTLVAALLVTVLATGALAQDVQDEDPKLEMKQQQKHLQNWEEAALNAHGENHRRGDEFKQVGGPHGPFGTGPDEEAELEDVTLFFLEGLDEAPAGQMLQHGWGPGDSSLDAPCGAFGPNYDGDGFGPGGDGSGEGEPSDLGSHAQNRTGRG